MFIRTLTLLSFLTLAFLALNIPSVLAQGPSIGEAAPDFTATDIHGKTITMSELRGHPVVLEWTNNHCPFVKKHYGSGNMQATQKTAIQDHGAYWITVISSAPNRQGYVSAEEAAELEKTRGANPSTQILDPTGEIGHLYGAQTTPHMFVIDAQGALAYKGAIDDKSSPSPKTIEGAKNYVLAALDSLKAGSPVETPSTAPYGCAVKYAH